MNLTTFVQSIIHTNTCRPTKLYSINYEKLLKGHTRTPCTFNCIIDGTVSVFIADTPQFLGGNPYFFCENLYQSVSFVDASMYHAIFHAIRVAIQFAKNRDIA